MKKKKIIIISSIVITLIISIIIIGIIINKDTPKKKNYKINSEKEAQELLENYYPGYEFKYIDDDTEFYKFQLSTDDNIEYWIRKEDGASVPYYAESTNNNNYNK